MKSIFLAVSLWTPIAAMAGTGWTPQFNDKPVNPKLVQAIEQALPDSPVVQPKEARKLLVFSATAGYRHQSIPTGKLALEKMGASTGAYETVISDDPAYFEPSALQQFDAVVLLNTTQDFFMPKAKTHRAKYTAEAWAALQARHNRLVDNLIDYVQQGGGLVGIHAATDSCYQHEAYGETIGGYFAGHPWGSRHNVTIVVEDAEHALNKPVFEGMDDFSIKEEIYQFREQPYSRDKLRVLLRLDPERSDAPNQPDAVKRTDGDFPVAWVQRVGTGRVFYTSLGHNHEIFSNPLLLRHYLAGIQFATGDLVADTTPSTAVQIPGLKR